MSQLTPRIVALLLNVEGLVREAYLDTSVPPVWTWAGGITSASGINVGQYKDNPQPLDVCVKAVINRITQKFLPSVLTAFSGHNLTENELAAALSFHWNTGAIRRAIWVQDFLEGHPKSAAADIMSWSSHGALTARRAMERDLFFNDVWPTDLRAAVWSVEKPSYHLGKDTPTDVMPILQQILGGS